MKEIEHSVGKDDSTTSAMNVLRNEGRLILSNGANACSLHRPEIRMPLEKVQRCGGRKMPVSLVRDVTRIE